MEKSDSKDKIFRAAAELFARQGYYNVSVNEICSSAGVTKPVLYYYFEDKEHLLLELANEAHNVIEELTTRYLSEKNSFIENLENMNTMFLHYTKEYTYLIPFSFWIQFVPLPEKIKVIINGRIKSGWKNLKFLFIKGQEEGYLAKELDPVLLMRSLFNPLSVIIVQYVLSDRKKVPLEKSLGDYFEFWRKQFVKMNKPRSSSI